jgi:hypothetical protein
MSKPILIVKCPISLSPTEVRKVGDSIGNNTELKNDYHILIVSGHADGFQFDGLYPKDFDVSDLEAVKKRLGGDLIEII